jgi:hypothetical protein
MLCATLPAEVEEPSLSWDREDSAGCPSDPVEEERKGEQAFRIRSRLAKMHKMEQSVEFVGAGRGIGPGCRARAARENQWLPRHG